MPTAMLAATIAHQHDIEETFLIRGKAAIGARDTRVAMGGDPPQRGWQRPARLRATIVNA